MEYERRGEALLRGPLGCALLLDVATNLGYPFDFFADPAVSFWLAGTAADWCDPWGNAYQLDWALQDGAGCSDLALAIGQDPAFAWWWDPLDLETQVWVSGRMLRGNASADHNQSDEPLVPFLSEDWRGDKRYQVTSELRDGKTALGTACALNAADYNVCFPLSAWRVRFLREVRVWEVHAPEDWHALCVAYPRTREDGRLAPDWEAAAREWDGVHISLGGVLSSERVRNEDGHGWSMMEEWNVERTRWIADVPVEGERIPDFQRSAHFQELARYGYGWAESESRRLRVREGSGYMELRQ